MQSEYWHWNARIATNVMQDGGVIAHPTEAVWGLACDPFCQSAVHKILKLKDRPVEKGLILVSAYPDHFHFLTRHLSQEELSLFLSPSDRPTTWLIPDPDDIVPVHIKGQFDSVALRVSQHPIVRRLSQLLDGPIVSTSANPAGRPPALNIAQARHYFYGRIDYLLNGKLGGHQAPSQIIDIKTQQTIRN